MMKIGDGSKPAAGVSDDDNKLVVQQVKEVGVTLRYPMLSENNYSVWAMKMKIFMHAQGVWAAMVNKAGADEKMDQMALAAIVQAVLEAVVMSISEHETAKEAWDALKEMNMGEERVKKAQVQTLKRKLDGMYMGDSKKINDFVLKVTTERERDSLSRHKSGGNHHHREAPTFHPRQVRTPHQRHRAMGECVGDDGDGDNQASAGVRGVFKGAAS
jgi:hypothetical protein